MTDMLTGKDALIARLEDENATLRRELAEKDQSVTQERQAISVGVTDLRRQLSPLYTALRQVFGEMEGLAGDESTGGPSVSPDDPRVARLWVEWKSKLSPACGRLIDVLLIHQDLNIDQMCVAAKMGKNTVYRAISAMNKPSLLVKNGNRFSLKKL